ncbi:MAG: tRNA (adenosine(37)-N6)-threonylcarbamoyltransferase complex dimerization subunit type 1 TsaB [Ignavibacteria bacterium]|nr:tRNA (adenosine(37)-N6)-threonylcarbamoyltransferase complex dimerization subunit type 1 TsaB [Ignavibacteria bacterium]
MNEPLILSIETSGATCGVVLSSGSKMIAEYSLFGDNLHDKLLAELCRRIKNDCGKTFDQLDAVAVSAGPGSFTGLRIGASVAKGICFGSEIKCIAVPTLSAFASAATEYAQSLGNKEIMSVIGANQNLFFSQSFDANGKLKSTIQLTEQEEIQSRITEQTILCGPAAPSFHTHYQLSGLNRLTPRFIARHAFQLWNESAWITAEDFVPMYAQEFVVKKAVK